MNLTREEFGLRRRNVGEEEQRIPSQSDLDHTMSRGSRTPILQTQLAASVLELGLQAGTEKG